MALQAGRDGAGIECVGEDAFVAPATGDLDGVQDVGRFGLAVGQPRVVVAILEVDIGEVHGRDPMRAGAHRDDTRTILGGGEGLM